MLLYWVVLEDMVGRFSGEWVRLWTIRKNTPYILGDVPPPEICRFLRGGSSHDFGGANMFPN